MNTGEVVVRPITTGEGHTEYTPIGHTANLASRLQALARRLDRYQRADSQASWKATSSSSRWFPPLKGVTEPVRVYEVAGLGPLRSRLDDRQGADLSKFVGRQDEMSGLTARQSWPKLDAGSSWP